MSVLLPGIVRTTAPYTAATIAAGLLGWGAYAVTRRATAAILRRYYTTRGNTK